MPVVEKGAEKKKRIMAKAAIVNSEEGIPNRALSLFTRSRDFLKDVRSEMRKVVTPSAADVRSTTIVVILSVFAFAAFFYVVDAVLGSAVKYLYHWMGAIQ
ncbi:MAG TPA: preprotein translocase subunit SecE [Acidobacteriaceae bacterium]|jgi:preprotein translocase subunit SecE|nr:preprotein translocase subunit SecE [Acidobacteriaceae bacterium]